MTGVTPQRWACGHLLSEHTRYTAQACIAAQLAERGASAPLDAPAPIDTEPKAALPHVVTCSRHGLSHVSTQQCVQCREEMNYGIRVTATDDNRELLLSFYNVPIPPEIGMKLALALLDASIRLMDRRAQSNRAKEEGTSSNA